MNVIRAKSHHLKLKSRGFIRNIYLLQRGIYGQKFDILILHCTATEKKKNTEHIRFNPSDQTRICSKINPAVTLLV